jgi:hypothetical protein
MRRASVSITSNLAEGFGRKNPLENQLIIAKDLKYLTENEYDDISNQTVIVGKLTNGLILPTSDYSLTRHYHSGNFRIRWQL